ncbi:MAG: MazG nucleotide pyrophosphohydrolase domain-containing protein [Promethearchaeota archaeon]
MSELQKKVDLLVSAEGGYWEPLAMLAASIEELGEVSRELNALEGPKKKKSGKTTHGNDFEVLSEELGDLLFSITCLFNYYKIDMDSSIEKVLSKYKMRDRGRFTSSVPEK